MALGELEEGGIRWSTIGMAGNALDGGRDSSEGARLELLVTLEVTNLHTFDGGRDSLEGMVGRNPRAGRTSA